VATPKDDIFAAADNKYSTTSGEQKDDPQSVVTTIKNPAIAIVGLEWDICRGVVRQCPLTIIKRCADLGQRVLEFPSGQFRY
jgi:hypothetical protein